MPFAFVNRKGDTYYLHAGTTRTGKPKYWFSRQSGDNTVERVPPGFEVYEKPESGQVLLRKSKPSQLTAVEHEMVMSAVRREAGLRHFRVDVEGDRFVIYTPNLDEDSADRLLDQFGLTSFRRETTKEQLVQHSNLCKMMRFTLVDPNTRLFQVERWCFKGAIDNWIYVGGPSLLADLVRSHVKHLGKESFFDLM